MMKVMGIIVCCLFLSGCPDDDEGGEGESCRRDDDYVACDDGLVCDNGACVPPKRD